MTRLLFVCLGNICRSPTAEVVFRDLLRREGLEGAVEVASAGTGGHFAGHGSPSEAVRAARAAGLDLSGHRARQVTAADFESFDYLIAMDRENLADLQARRAAGARAELRLLLDHCEQTGLSDVPDPYMGEAGFEQTFQVVEAGCRGLLDWLIREGAIER